MVVEDERLDCTMYSLLKVAGPMIVVVSVMESPKTVLPMTVRSAGHNINKYKTCRVKE